MKALFVFSLVFFSVVSFATNKTNDLQFQGLYSIDSFQVVGSYKQEFVFTQNSTARLETLLTEGYQCQDLKNFTYICKLFQDLKLNDAELNNLIDRVFNNYKIEFESSREPIVELPMEEGGVELQYQQAISIENQKYSHFFISEFKGEKWLYTKNSFGNRVYEYKIRFDSGKPKLVWMLSFERKIGVNQKEVLPIEVILGQPL